MPGACRPAADPDDSDRCGARPELAGSVPLGGLRGAGAGPEALRRLAGAAEVRCRAAGPSGVRSLLTTHVKVGSA